MAIFYPEADIHIQWPGVEPLGYHYLAFKEPSLDKYIYCQYDNKPGKKDIYRINIEVPLDTTSDIEVLIKCSAKSGSYIRQDLNPNNAHFIVTLGYNDGIINEVYASKNFNNLTSNWEEYSSIVALNQPKYFHHYHSLSPTPGREEQFFLHDNKSYMCGHTIIRHDPPPAILSAQQILNEINYIAITAILVDPSAYIYVSSLHVELVYV